MAPFDDASTYPDISAEQPAGENLEFDPDFNELGRLAQGKPEQQYGSTIVPAEDPNWKDVIAAATALTERTYDLRVLVLLAVARLHLQGLPPYVEVLGTIRHMLETRWASVHPQLDPEDDNDPLLRANALLTLAEPVRVLRFLRDMPLARSPRAGTVSWRDVAVSVGTLEVEEDAPRMTESVIAGAFRDADAATLASLREALDTAVQHVAAIPAVFNNEAGYGTGPDYTDLDKQLRDMLRMVDTYARPTAEPETEEAPPPAEGDAPAAAAAPRSAPVMSIATMGPPTNREDAMRLLDLVVEFYERHEPSSPLPLLINRARRLANKSFMDVLRDLAPDGLNQAETIAGRPEYE